LCSVEQVGTFQVLLPPRYAIIFYCRRPAAMLHARYWNLFGRSLDALLSLALLAAGWLAATSLLLHVLSSFSSLFVRMNYKQSRTHVTRFSSYISLFSLSSEEIQTTATEGFNIFFPGFFLILLFSSPDEWSRVSPSAFSGEFFYFIFGLVRLKEDFTKRRW
jgi:branched-subunit amino acid permease